MQKFLTFHTLACMVRLLGKSIHMSSFLQMSLRQNLYKYTDQILTDDHLFMWKCQWINENVL